MFHFHTQQPAFSRCKMTPIIPFLGDLAHQYFVLFILICDEYYWNFLKNPFQNHDFKHVRKHGNCVRFVHHKTGQCFRDFDNIHISWFPRAHASMQNCLLAFLSEREDLICMRCEQACGVLLFPNSLFLPCILAVSMWSNITRPWFVGIPKLD